MKKEFEKLFEECKNQFDLNAFISDGISFCHSQVTNLCNRRGHENLFKPLYLDMLYIRNKFLNKA